MTGATLVDVVLLLVAVGAIVLSARLPERAFARQGTGVQTRLHVLDRLGDGMAALTVLIGVNLLALPTHGFFAFLDFYFSNTGLVQQFDEFFYFTNIHGYFSFLSW